MENKPVCHCRLITDSNVSAEGALSVAWEHHLPVSNVLHIISLPPLVSSLLLSWCSTVMKIAGKRGNWEPASLLSSITNLPLRAHTFLQKPWLTCYLWYVCLLIFLFFQAWIWEACGSCTKTKQKQKSPIPWFYTSTPQLLFLGAVSIFCLFLNWQKHMRGKLYEWTWVEVVGEIFERWRFLGWHAVYLCVFV